jgi:glutamate N-acetyltransferase/amino-acid N-acetyltransferase
VISRHRLRRGRTRAILINSGCANCLTGVAGERDALLLGRAAARAVGVREDEVLLASTGIIGRRLPVPRMERAIPRLVAHLSRRNHHAAAAAILTTDRLPKEAAVEATLDGRTFRVGGMAKGAGMIAPSMATMLCVLTTDVAASRGLLSRLLRDVTARTFNRITVDGDMSTNDTVFALANGRSGVTIREGTSGARLLREAMEAVAGRLAKRIVQDGEGAERIMEVQVLGARDDREALACARQVACSLLVKTMLAGGDPNVGRLAGAAGASPAHLDPDKLEIHINGRRVVARGTALRLSKGVLRRLLARPEVTVTLHLHAGRGQGRMLTCDLTTEYVRINSGYAT